MRARTAADGRPIDGVRCRAYAAGLALLAALGLGLASVSPVSAATLTVSDTAGFADIVAPPTAPAPCTRRSPTPTSTAG